MELEFEKKHIPCLEMLLREVQNTEQTLELKLSEGMPDVGQIICAWGQVILRGKEWRPDSLRLSGGVMVWVLYSPEEGGQPECLEGWMPFQLHWDLPPDSREGEMGFTTFLRSLDARPISARKIMVRAGVGALAEAYATAQVEIAQPQGDGGAVQFLKTSRFLNLMKEAGEKSFLLDEELELPQSAPSPEKILYCRMNPRIQEKKILSGKGVFRGSGNLHMLYRSQEGQLHSWDFELPFSQYAQLKGEYGPDAQMEVSPAVTAMEWEMDPEGRLRLKGAVTAQYLVTEKTPVELVEDAYLPGRDLELEMGEVEIPHILDCRREGAEAEQAIPAQADVVADVQFLPDLPIVRRQGEDVSLELPGFFQVLYYGEDGQLHGASARWVGEKPLHCPESCQITALPVTCQPQAELQGQSISLRAELPVELKAMGSQAVAMVSGAEPGSEVEPDPLRPSVILKRAGGKGLWDIAKANGTTVAAIREANHLQQEPLPGQMLLIPVGFFPCKG